LKFIKIDMMMLKITEKLIRDYIIVF